MIPIILWWQIKNQNQSLAFGTQSISYFLRNLNINCPNEVWSAEITYIPMNRGVMYLVAAMVLHIQL